MTDSIRICIDESCPKCGYPERLWNPATGDIECARKGEPCDHVTNGGKIK